ncbi:RagB/SusD family nutrient uptake outer membrane protein [Flavitalea sp. BT771]|uniref:RagB/SusD family nutrient uptake outer membrane protein n=1 Tax=Flavitalea sp. BT771 TaxID=3063329 RepID=UPI0026E376AB|nr:RagB/SusD family nutrient uptake outer membrane protein [Flavitalea sp. BT771]MDO6429599.1 RagB/SusD family nutrient uptake outer membrane protein [Flavitalea sp. BT771]MDV6218273.1 RagB/SusD family nutrient uptake outer membrane protein [Flavitalea sp. BT771]
MKHRYLFSILLVSLCATSCQKSFLQLNPPTQLNTGTFYKTADDFQQALIGVYPCLRNWALPTSWLMGESRSDNTRYDFNMQNRAVAILERENVDDWVDDANNSTTKTKYVADYAGIERANMILDKIVAANIDSLTRNNVTGEAEVLRAFFYFDLVQFYGGVPLNLHTVASPSQAFLTRASVADVYAAIIADLKDAITRLPTKVTFPQSGRVTIGTAEMLLANVCMVQKNYSQAQIALEAVTKLGYSLNASYANAFSTTNKNSAESIFEVQYQQGTANGQYSYFIYDFIPPMASTTVVTGTNTNTLSASGGQNVPTLDLINAYEPGDARLDATVGMIEGHTDANGNFVAESLKSIVGYTAPPGKVGRRFAKKYLHPSATPGQTDDNWPIYRYSDALLMLAESLNEQGKPADALPYLNQVRSRAGLPASVETDQTALRAVIAHERRIELALENKRWTDLLRTGQTIPVMTAFAALIKQDPRVPSNAYSKIDEDHLLFPIPASEIQLNPLIKQNHGY